MSGAARLFSAFILLFLIGCSGRAGIDPTSPSLNLDSLQQNVQVSVVENNRQLWGLWLVDVDTNQGTVEARPMKSAEMHMNAVHMLEVAPCNNCLQIKNLAGAPPTITLDLTIKHPEKDNINLTGFDARGILITDGDFVFPVNSRKVSLDGTHPVLQNPDGFTSLFNPIEFPPNTSKPYVLKYTDGKYAVGDKFSATLNPYVAFGKDNPRRMLLPGTEETRSIALTVPSGKFTFGYAVDVSWVDPGFKVTDPEKDFPPEANCIEAYQITSEMTQPVVEGGIGKVTVGVFDHQGKGTISKVYYECPDLFIGQAELGFESEGTDSAIYSGEISNTKNAGKGEYPSLVKVIDTSVDPNLGLISAWQISKAKVIDGEAPVAIASMDAPPFYINQAVNFLDGGSYDPDGGSITKYEWDFDKDGVFEKQGASQAYTWSVPGTNQVQLRVTDDEGATDVLDSAMEVTVEDVAPFNISEIDLPYISWTMEKMFSWNQYVYVKYEESQDLYVFDTSDATHPVLVNNTFNGHVNAFSEGYAYIYRGIPGQKQKISDIWDLTNPLNPHKVGMIRSYFTDVYTSNGILYGLTFHNAKYFLEIWDIHDFGNTYKLGSIETNAANLATVRVLVGYAYVFRTAHSLQIFDVDPPESPVSVAEIEHVDGHEIYSYSVSGNYLYINEYGADKLAIFDISDKANPTEVNTVDLPESVAVVETDGNTLFLASRKGMIADISDPMNIVLKDWGKVGFVDGPGRMWVDGNRMYVGERAGIAIIDNISNPQDGVVSGYVGNAHRLDRMKIFGNYACAVDMDQTFSQLPEGIQIIDISEPESPYVHATIPVDNTLKDYYVSGNYLYILEGIQSTLRIIKIEPGSPPTEVKSIQNNYSEGLGVKDGFAYLGSDMYLSIFDANPPEDINKIKDLDTVGSGYSFIDFSGTYVYMIGPYERIGAVNIASPAGAWLAGKYPATEISYKKIQEFSVAGDRACYTSTTNMGDPPDYQNHKYITVTDVDPIAEASILGEMTLDEYPVNGMSASGGYAYIAAGKDNLIIVDIDPPEDIHIEGQFKVHWWIDAGWAFKDVVVKDNHAYVASNIGFQIIKLW